MHPHTKEWVQVIYLITFQTNEGYYELWNQFQSKALQRLKRANGKSFKHGQIVWTSELAKAEHVEK